MDKIIKKEEEKQLDNYLFETVKGSTNLFYLLAIVLIAIVLLFNSIFIVNENQYGVINTLGNISVVSTPGIKFRIPLLQSVKKVSKEIVGMAIGYDPETNNSKENESLMITSDANFVNVDFYLEYKIIEPEKYLFNSSDPLVVLKNLAQSYIRDTVGSYTVDSVITTGKAEIENSVMNKLRNRMEIEDLGIYIINVTIQDAEPPTYEVSEAFKSVETAKQGADTAINNAKKYESEKKPAAEAEADEIIKTAEATKQARINEANGQVERFNQMYNEYIKFPETTKDRMFYEAMEEVLPKLQIIIDNGNNIQKWMPIQGIQKTTTYQEESEGAENE